MYTLSIISFLLLAVFLAACAIRHGVPPMVSDTYYQLPTEGRWLFPVILATAAMTLMPCLLEARPNIAAFISTAAIIFVAAAPAYRQEPDRQTHKAAATLAATGCLLWSAAASLWPTAVLAAAYALWLAAYRLRHGRPPETAWYWAEAACILDIYVTLWTIPA